MSLCHASLALPVRPCIQSPSLITVHPYLQLQIPSLHSHHSWLLFIPFSYLRYSTTLAHSKGLVPRTTAVNVHSAFLTVFDGKFELYPFLQSALRAQPSYVPPCLDGDICLQPCSHGRIALACRTTFLLVPALLRTHLLVSCAFRVLLLLTPTAENRPSS